MATKATTMNLIESKDIYQSTKAIVASNLAVTAAIIASITKAKITTDTIKEANRIFESCLDLLPLFPDVEA
jgi:hypothetical protein